MGVVEDETVPAILLNLLARQRTLAAVFCRSMTEGAEDVRLERGNRSSPM